MLHLLGTSLRLSRSLLNQRRNMTTSAIAIIGGGPCGLTLARLLERKGITYTVYEKDENEDTNRATGGSLDLYPKTGQLALQQAGLFGEFKKHARYEDAVFAVSDKYGKQMLKVDQERDAPEIDRTQLRQILLDSIPKGRIKWGYSLKNATLDEDHRPVLQFANGERVSGFKLVVGADGGWSKVRSLLTQAKPNYTGKSFLISTIGLDNALYPQLAQKVGAGTSLSIGSRKYILVQRQGNLSYRIFFGLQVLETFFRDGTIDISNLPSTRGILSNFYSDFAPEYKEIISNATDFRAWPLYTLSTEDMHWKSVPGVTVAGDAAHLGYPGGSGVNLAMADALDLSVKIVDYGIEGLNRGVREYEEGMFVRGAKAIEEGLVMSKVMFGEGPESFLKVLGGVEF